MITFLKKILDKYYLLFILSTLLYTVPFFIRLSSFINLFLMIFGVVLILIKETSFKDFILSNKMGFLFLSLTMTSIILKNENLVQNFKLLALSGLQLFVFMKFKTYDENCTITVKQIMKLLLIFSFVISFISILIYLLDINLLILSFKVGKAGNDLTGLYVHPNTAGFVAGISVIISIVFIKNKCSKTFKIFNILNMIIQMSIILFAHSNAPLILIIIYILLVLIEKIKRNKKDKLYCFTLMPIFSLNYVSSLKNVIEFLANGRFHLWYVGFLVIRNNPLFGVGPGNTSSAGRYYGNITGYSAIDNGGFHNSYIEVMAGVGILGFITIFYIILKKLRMLYSSNKKDLLYIAIAIMFYSIFESKLFFQASLLPTIFWMILGLV